MNVFLLIEAGLRSLSLLMGTTLSSGNSMRSDEISELLSLFANLIAQGEDVAEELRAFTEQMEQLVEEAREPTPEEWAALRSRSDAAHDTLQEAKTRIEGGDEPTVTLMTDDEKAELNTLLDIDSDAVLVLTEEGEARLLELNRKLANSPE